MCVCVHCRCNHLIIELMNKLMFLVLLSFPFAVPLSSIDTQKHFSHLIYLLPIYWEDGCRKRWQIQTSRTLVFWWCGQRWRCLLYPSPWFDQSHASNAAGQVVCCTTDGEGNKRAGSCSALQWPLSIGAKTNDVFDDPFWHLWSRQAVYKYRHFPG